MMTRAATPERCGDCEMLFLCRVCPDPGYMCLDCAEPGSDECAHSRAYARSTRRSSDGVPGDPGDLA